jgi:hypothetical protein
MWLQWIVPRRWGEVSSNARVAFVSASRPNSLYFNHKKH